MAEPSGQILFQESFPVLRNLWRKYWSVRRSKTFRSPDVVISPSNWLLDFHKQFNLFRDSKTMVIPNPCNTPRKILDGIELSSTRRNRAELDKTQTSILYVGRVSKDKGAELLVDAWQRVVSEIEVRCSKFDVRLKLIGDGPYLEQIKRLNDPTIECLGALDHSDLAMHYAEATLFVFPSLLMENQPTVLLEAISAGLNIVASDIGGVGELLRGYGILVPPGNADKLADAINTEITKNPNLALGREILSRHDIDIVMEEYLLTFNH
jgi:glycosyltransferase involved in cell wall biosynthesis